MIQPELYIPSIVIIVVSILVYIPIRGILLQLKKTTTAIENASHSVSDSMNQVSQLFDYTKQVISSINNTSNAILKHSEVIADLSLKVSQQNQTLQEIREKIGDIKSSIPSLVGLESLTTELGNKTIHILIDGFSKLNDIKSVMQPLAGIENSTTEIGNKTIQILIDGFSKLNDIKSVMQPLVGIENSTTEFGKKTIQCLLDGFSKLDNLSKDISNEIKQGTRHVSVISEEMNKNLSVIIDTLNTMHKPLQQELINLRKSIETDVNSLTSLEG